MKRVFSCILVVGFLISGMGAVAMAASAKCTVVESSEKSVVLDCGSDWQKFPVDSKVKIKSAKKVRKPVEGC